VLDEATSALDSEVEASIQQALSRVMQGKTVLAIAHRLSTIAAMDRIIVLDRGRIVEEGNHAALLAAGGLYARYWKRQSGGFIGTEDGTGRVTFTIDRLGHLGAWHRGGAGRGRCSCPACCRARW
jgi:ATP-binding cassette subfamily B protein